MTYLFALSLTLSFSLSANVKDNMPFVKRSKRPRDVFFVFHKIDFGIWLYVYLSRVKEQMGRNKKRYSVKM